MSLDTITIPYSKQESVTKKLNKLVKKATKYGNADIKFSFSDPYLSEYTDDRGVKRDVKMTDVTVEGDAPVYEGGWTLLARVELFSELNLVHEVPNIDHKIDGRFRSHGNICEHCNKDRKRNNLYVFGGSDSSQVAVGRSCLHDFMGIDNPQMIVERAAFFESIKDISDEEFTSYFAESVSVKEVLVYSAAEIRVNGWTSNANAYEYGIESTSDRVKQHLINNPKFKIEVTDIDRKNAADTADHFKTMELTGNNYIDNLCVIMQESAVGLKLVGILASAITAYNRELAQRAEKENKAENPSIHVGTVGERMRNIVVTMTKEIFIGETQYGSKYLYAFNDVDGNEINWFTGHQDIVAGDKMIIDASVKEHKVYNGVKQTIVTRAKIK